MPGDSPWASLLWMLFCVAAVTGLAYWFTKFVLGKRRFGMQKDQKLSVLATIGVGRSQRIAVLRAGKRYFLLGLTEQNITKISELTEEEAACWEEKPRDGENPSFGQAFKEQLEKKLRGEKK